MTDMIKKKAATEPPELDTSRVVRSAGAAPEHSGAASSQLFVIKRAIEFREATGIEPPTKSHKSAKRKRLRR